MKWNECLGITHPHSTLHKNYHDKSQRIKLLTVRLSCFKPLLQKGFQFIELLNMNVNNQDKITCGCEHYRRKSWDKSKPYEPCKSAGKHPRQKKNKRVVYKSLDTLSKAVRKCSTSNWGIELGAKTGFWVLDVDVRNGGLESLRQLEELTGPLPQTMKVITGGVAQDVPGVPDGSRGYHLYFKHPGAGFQIKRWLNKRWPGLDVKGDDGFTVAPLSFHASGHFYYLEDKDQTVAEAPAALLDMVCEDLSKPKRRISSNTQSNSSVPLEMTNEELNTHATNLRTIIALNPALANRIERYNESALQQECAKVAQAPHGEGYATKCSASYKVGQLVSGNNLDYSYARECLFSASQQRGGKLRFDVIEQCLRNGLKQPRTIPHSVYNSSENTNTTCSQQSSKNNEETKPANRCSTCLNRNGPCQTCFEYFVGSGPHARQYPDNFYCTQGQRWLGQHLEKPHKFIFTRGRCNRWKCDICGATKSFEITSHLKPAFDRIGQGITLEFAKKIEEPPREVACRPVVYRLELPYQYCKGYNQKLANLGFVKSAKFLTFQHQNVIYMVIPPDADPQKLVYRPRNDLNTDGSIADSASKPVFTPTQLSADVAWTEIVKHVNLLGVHVKLNLPVQVALRDLTAFDSSSTKRGLSGVSLRGGWQMPERLKKGSKYRYLGQCLRDSFDLEEYVKSNDGILTILPVERIDRSELIGMPRLLMEMQAIIFKEDVPPADLTRHIAWMLNNEPAEIWPVHSTPEPAFSPSVRKLCHIQPFLFK